MSSEPVLVCLVTVLLLVDCIYNKYQIANPRNCIKININIEIDRVEQQTLKGMQSLLKSKIKGRFWGAWGAMYGTQGLAHSTAELHCSPRKSFSHQKL